MNRGYVRLYRRVKDSSIFAHEGLFKLFSLCLLKATHKEITITIPGILEPVSLKPGQFVTGRESLHYDYHQGHVRRKYSPKQSPSPITLYRWLVTLQNMEILTIDPHSKYSVITIINWHIYQSENAESPEISKDSTLFQPISGNCPILNTSEVAEYSQLSMTFGAGLSDGEQRVNNKRTTDDHKQEQYKNNKEDIGGKIPHGKKGNSPHVTFKNWFFQKYEYKFQRPYMVTNWKQFGSQINTLLKLPITFEDLQYIAIEFFMDVDSFITGSDKGPGAGHNIGMLLTRINQNVYRKYLDPEFRESNKRHIVNEDGKTLYPETTEPGEDNE